MRVPSMPQERIMALIEPIDPAAIQRVRDAAPDGGIIITAAHVGNNDVVGAAIAHLGLPLSVVADDSSFPELFEHLRLQRERWSATMIPWRNLRGIFGVLRRRELLGLLVDWGYRSDGIPVKLFDAWTTLPAGPATLAAKTSSQIVPAITTRQPDGRLRVVLGEAIVVASSDPAELQRATQAIADALELSIRPSPEQWYSFKPIWPAGAAESADLERRATAMQAGRPDPGPVRDGPRDEADQVEVGA
jgi:KDO2-lipid IV(A) lauroyltransferase